MKRSEVNALIEEAKAFFARHRFHLPPWAFWAPGDWRGRRGAGALAVASREKGK